MKKLIVVALLATGCTYRTSQFEPVTPANSLEYEGGLPAVQVGCGWLAVDDAKALKILGIPIRVEARQFGRQLYYCCPGADEPQPTCYRAIWEDAE